MNVKILRFIDRYLISLFLLFIVPLKKKGFNHKSILIIKLWALGDSVLTLPLIEGIKKSFPSCKIDVLVTKRNKDIYTVNKSIDRVILLNLGNVMLLRRKYDLAFDLEPYLNVSALISFWCSRFRIGFSNQLRSKLYDKKVVFRKNQHMVQNYLDMLRSLGKKYDAACLVKLDYSKKEDQFIDSTFKTHNLNKNDFIVGICPGVAESVKSRMWPLERFAELADLLVKKKNAKVIFIDSPSNKKIVNKIQGMMQEKSINLAGKTSLKQTFALISRCRLFISNDTGPMHVAAAQGVKTIGLFGPNIPILWGPYGKGNISLYHKVQCSPCIDNAKGKMPKCFNKEYQKCMRLISADEVLRAIR